MDFGFAGVLELDKMPLSKKYYAGENRSSSNIQLIDMKALNVHPK